jgi:hypothetical protein
VPLAVAAVVSVTERSRYLSGPGPAMLKKLDLMQYFVAVKRLDVSRLSWREASNRPAQMYEVRLDWMRKRVHPDFFRQPIPLPRVTRAARSDDVVPIVGAAT